MGDPLTTIRDLTNAIAGEIRLGLHDRMLYATDASIYQVEPLAVVIPADTDDAARAVAFCCQHGLPILPRGGGTSLAGQGVSRAVVIDLSPNCAHILGVEGSTRRCRVEPGVTIAALNQRLKPAGLFFAPDPATIRQANIGGCIGNNAAGMRSIKYGRTSESVLGVDVCLADGRRVRLDAGAARRDATARDLTERVVAVVRAHAGEVRARFPKTKRRNAGYALDDILAQLDAGTDPLDVNLAPLLCGSEGTLAVTLGAELNLHPLPQARGLAVIAFEALDAAVDAVAGLLELNPSAVELLDDMILGLARLNPAFGRDVDLLPDTNAGQPAAVLFVEFEGTRGDVDAGLGRVRDKFPPASITISTESRDMDRAWALRRAAQPLLYGVSGHRKPVGFVEDCAVPPERLPEFVRAMRAIFEGEQTRGSFFAHASVGVLHVRPLLDLRDDGDEQRMRRIALKTADLVRSLGGVMSGEHGDGRVRGPLLPDYFGPGLMDAFRQIKAIFDPKNLLNLGNIVEPDSIGSISTNLRVRPMGVGVEPGRGRPGSQKQQQSDPVSIPRVDTYFNFDDQGDFAHAVERCNGAGVCRKTTEGVMCPSYLATRDERHSTRGRGNALRLAISGQLGSTNPGLPAWDDPETLATLDLCLSCKACKSECPSNVDIARLKAEYLAQGFRTGRAVTRSARTIGNIDTLNRRAALAPRFANWIAGRKLTRRLMEGFLGIDRRRSLPRFERPLYARWASPSLPLGPDAPRVLLLGDTFTTHNEPHIALAAKRVLEAFGYRVDLFDGSDYARALIVQGLLGRAVVEAESLIERLRPVVEHADWCRGLLAVEPSVCSAIRDDWLALNMGVSIECRRRVAAMTDSVEQFLHLNWDDHPRRPEFFADDRRVLFHEHCLSKALHGVGSGGGLLRRAYGARAVEVIDASCCGMAGAFGFMRDKYDLSMKIGELDGRGVLPRVRAAGKNTIVCAAGTSCRHQIRDGAGMQALHPIEAVERVIQR